MKVDIIEGERLSQDKNFIKHKIFSCLNLSYEETFFFNIYIYIYSLKPSFSHQIGNEIILILFGRKPQNPHVEERVLFMKMWRSDTNM